MSENIKSTILAMIQRRLASISMNEIVHWKEGSSLESLLFENADVNEKELFRTFFGYSLNVEEGIHLDNTLGYGHVRLASGSVDTGFVDILTQDEHLKRQYCQYKAERVEQQYWMLAEHFFKHPKHINEISEIFASVSNCSDEINVGPTFLYEGKKYGRVKLILCGDFSFNLSTPELANKTFEKLNDAAKCDIEAFLSEIQPEQITEKDCINLLWCLIGFWKFSSIEEKHTTRMRIRLMRFGDLIKGTSHQFLLDHLRESAFGRGDVMESESFHLSLIDNIATNILAAIELGHRNKFAILCAISAIMSRNMSHNLGSHVLTRKVREHVRNANEFVGDSQIFDKYLQQRMDFLAQISTEQPKWLDTACLSHQVMALFLKQRKILQYITRSEGLTATEFDKNGAIKESHGEYPRLGFVMRYVKQKKGKLQEVKPLLNFTATGKGDDKIVFPYRVPVAFPGGSIGWQALFVILEGFLRNVAKHSYAGLADTEKKDLNILIDVVDDGNTFTISKKPALRIRLYTDVSKNVVCRKLEDGVRLKDKVDELNRKLVRSFIDDSTGKLRKANWGLAELRICSGFLQQADVMDIGGDLADTKLDERVVSVKKADETLLPPLIDEHGSYDLAGNQLKEDDKRFFFEFKVLKPRIIGAETGEDGWANEGAKELRQAEGWEHGDCTEPATLNTDRSFEYYVLGPDNEFGQRIIEVLTGTNEIPLGCENCPVYGKLDYYPGRLFIVSDKQIEAFSEGTLEGQLRKRICVLSEQEDWKRLKNWYNASSEDYEVSPTDRAALFLQQKWVEHLFVNVRGFNKGEGLALYHFLNESESADFSGYSPNTTPYKDNHVTSEASHKIVLRMRKEGQQDCAFVFGRHFGVLENSEWEQNKFKPKVRIEGATSRQKNESNGEKKEDLLYGQDILLYGEGMSGNASYYSIAEQMFSENFEQKELLDINVVFSEQRLYSSARMLLRFAESALLRVVVIDERFQEQFSSLRNKPEQTTLTRVAEQQVLTGYLDSETEYTQAKPSRELSDFGYVLIQKNKSKTKGEYKAILKRKHKLQECPELFQAAGSFSGDILIIHQGILDKWFEKHSGQNHGGDEKKVVEIGKLLKCMRQHFQYVAITSGRGRPNNNDMPSGVRFLPLSCIESGPQSGHYEKYPLVQQVLEIVETMEQ